VEAAVARPLKVLDQELPERSITDGGRQGGLGIGEAFEQAQLQLPECGEERPMHRRVRLGRHIGDD